MRKADWRLYVPARTPRNKKDGWALAGTIMPLAGSPGRVSPGDAGLAARTSRRLRVAKNATQPASSQHPRSGKKSKVSGQLARAGDGKPITSPKGRAGSQSSGSARPVSGLTEARRVDSFLFRSSLTSDQIASDEEVNSAASNQDVSRLESRLLRWLLTEEQLLDAVSNNALSICCHGEISIDVHEHNHTPDDVPDGAPYLNESWRYRRHAALMADQRS
jgi:hypothetical protein